jgi:hypothetical protein
MSKFLKLTSLILNTNHISRVIAKQNLYEIHLMNYGSNGFHLMGTGSLCNSVDVYQVCSETHTNDYKKVSDWIHSLPE